MTKHVTIDNVMDWISPTPSRSNALILEDLADTIADLLNGNYTIAQLRNAILNDKPDANRLLSQFVRPEDWLDDPDEDLPYLTAPEIMASNPSESDWEPEWKIIENCRYCGLPAANNKQGQWGLACSGCKGSLTTRLRSGKYGPTYDKTTKERLMATRYNPNTGKWIEGLTRHWYEYDWNWIESLSKSGKPRLDYDYVDRRIPITKEELLREEIG